MALLRAWLGDTIEVRGQPCAICVLPRSGGYITFNRTTKIFYRRPTNGPFVSLQNPYHAIRQLWKIAQKVLIKCTTFEQARHEIVRVRGEVIKLLRQNAWQGEARSWRYRLKHVLKSLEKINHGSIQEVKDRLLIIVKPEVDDQHFDFGVDTLGRVNSGSTQAMLAAGERRVEQAEDDNLRINERVVYHMLLLQELVKEFESHLGFIEKYVGLLRWRTFGNILGEGLREPQAAKYCIEDVIYRLQNFFWCEPFANHRADLENLAFEIRDLVVIEDEKDIPDDRWIDIHNKSAAMLALINGLQVQIGLEHMRQDLAESLAGGAITSEVWSRLTNIEARLQAKGAEAVETLINEVHGHLDLNRVTSAYQAVGKHIKPQPPANARQVEQAATTA